MCIAGTNKWCNQMEHPITDLSNPLGPRHSSLQHSKAIFMQPEVLKRISMATYSSNSRRSTARQLDSSKTIQSMVRASCPFGLFTPATYKQKRHTRRFPKCPYRLGHSCIVPVRTHVRIPFQAVSVASPNDGTRKPHVTNKSGGPGLQSAISTFNIHGPAVSI